MSETVIQIENLAKQYRLGTIGTGTLTQDVNRWWHRVRGKEDPYMKVSETNDRSKAGNSDFVWALKDINFEVKRGDIVGIIGRNGAGKSTLLKILSRTTTPTTGMVRAKGRIASLLEVGTGFHPELTGRENIFLNGAIMGMKKAEITAKFDQIVSFAEVERYIDTPVKRYSSGMYVRLAFAVAAHLEPEILIVDEVLAVGDAEFQKKALGKMKDVSSGQGRTVLFVSHNMGAMRQLCKDGVLLKQGQIETTGRIEDVIRQYFLQGYQADVRPPVAGFRSYNIASSPVVIEQVYVNDDPTVIPVLSMAESSMIHIRLAVTSAITRANVTISFFNDEGTRVGLAFSWDDDFFLTCEAGVTLLSFEVNKMTLTPGSYFIGIGINQSTHTIAWDGIASYPIFRIENRNDVLHFTHRPWGINHISGSTWTTKKLSQ
jgi:lipopolysaccharide transport system ATP-binding protein